LKQRHTCRYTSLALLLIQLSLVLSLLLHKLSLLPLGILFGLINLQSTLRIFV
jgi:hypothetical protein